MNVWAVRAGADGEYEDYALSAGVALVDFGLRQSLANFADRDDLRDFLNADPDSIYYGRLRSAANAASQLWRFANHMQVGDMILLPRKKARAVAVGRVAGEYRLDADIPFDACHARDVEWRAVDVPREGFDAGILTAIRSMLTVFQVKREGAEARIDGATRAYLSGEMILPPARPEPAREPKDDAPPAPAAPETPPTAAAEPAPPADQPPMDIDALIEQRIIHRIRERFGADGFGYLMTAILEMSGYAITRTTRADGGASVHIHLERDSAADGGGAKETLLAHLMSGESAASANDVERLRAGAEEIGATSALLVSMSGFIERPPDPEPDPDADGGEEAAPAPRLMDASDVVSQILESYDALPAYVRANIPLRQRMVLVELED